MLPILYSEVNILCILFLLLIYFKTGSDTYSQSNRRFFRWVLLSNCFFFALDALWVFVDTRSLPLGIAANWTLNSLYYITSGIVSFLWFLYSEGVQQSSLVKDKTHILICSAPMLLLTVLTLISLKTGWLFYIDEFNVYHRGRFYILQLLLSYGYIVFTAAKALVLSFNMTSYYKKTEYRTLVAFVLPSLTAGIIQVFLPGISLLCVGTTFGLLFVFLTVQERMISTDGLTGLNNRNRMTQYLSEKMSRQEDGTRLFVMMMDLDYFKQINDRYGHIEGDKALCLTAGALKACCNSRRFFLARYGGDEFAAICELKPDESIDDFCQSIRDAMLEINKDTPYFLTLSIGYAEYQPDIKTEQEFIKLADSELYKAKLSK